MDYIIPASNWIVILAQAIKESEDGDVIICRTSAMIKLGESAKARMCPEKRITFKVSYQPHHHKK